MRSPESMDAEIDSLWENVRQLHQDVSDHAQRLETAQTHQWKRVLFWLDGWSWTDWNATKRRWRPWHRGD